MREEQIKKIKEMTRQEEFFLDEKEFVIASCDHTKNGKPMTEPFGDKGNQTRCRICKKVMDFSNLPKKEQLMAAFDVIDTAIDLVKLGNDELDDDVRMELGKLSVYRKPIEKLYKKTYKELNERKRPQGFYPGAPGSEYGMGAFLMRQAVGGFPMGGGRMMDDDAAFGGNKKKKKNKHKNHYNEY